MANAYRTSQKRNLGIIENLKYQTHAPVGPGGFPIVGRYAGCLLPSMLQRKQGEVDRRSNIIARLIFEGYTDYPAGVVQIRPPFNSRPFSSTCSF
jgi:hypothetical protein